MVSVLFNEPKLLKSSSQSIRTSNQLSFSTLQRAEIAEMTHSAGLNKRCSTVSVLFNEPKLLKCQAMNHPCQGGNGFSTLQRAEIAEIRDFKAAYPTLSRVSVLFNEPKLLKSDVQTPVPAHQKALFQYSSTSRNC